MTQSHSASPSSQNAPFFVDTEIITLNKNGVWLSDQVEIDHEQTVRMFARCLRRDEQGYFLQIGHETKRIIVEDTAYFVTGLVGTVDTVELRLNDGSHEPLDPITLNYRPGRLVCRIKGGREEARFLSTAYFDLLKNLEEDDNTYFIQLSGQKIVLAPK